ncbi:hypothetical protein [Vibrio cholerae]|uniref:hypothetical protein n=1 Tax=Vibrio cholerae TaxID=666 RepID=UPI000E0A37AD|nr:hypothetical protein [Vibrio cholerae]EGR4143611.1 hypothetical protein [Vibrio cholerae]EJL6757584.1 hypothetical protein [Vibrio cholerae]
MTWWIAFIIAVLGWYFTSRQNAKNSIRSLINQEIKESRAKLHELIVSCSGSDCQLPLQAGSADFVKMQTYIVSVQELEKLYISYNTPVFTRIRVVSTCLSKLNRLFELQSLNRIKKFTQYWCTPESYHNSAHQNSSFEISEHAANIRKSLTSDADYTDKDARLSTLNLEYKQFCLSYQFVS